MFIVYLLIFLASLLDHESKGLEWLLFLSFFFLASECLLQSFDAQIIFVEWMTSIFFFFMTSIFIDQSFLCLAQMEQGFSLVFIIIINCYLFGRIGS